MAVYTYLRLIVDHHGTSQLQVLRQKEVDFCISLLRERVSKSGDSKAGWEESPASLGTLCVVALPVFLMELEAWDVRVPQSHPSACALRAALGGSFSAQTVNGF